jgi:hypothetical protein
MKIHFKEEGHVYWEESTNEKYISVTQLKGRYIPPFPREYMSKYKAIERLAGDKYDRRFKTFKLHISEYGKDKGMERFIKTNPFFTEKQILGMQEIILLEWDQKAEEGKKNGSEWHDKQELKAKVQQRVFEGTNVLKLSDYYMYNTDEPRLSSDLPDGVYVELLMALHPYKIAGKCDRLYIESAYDERGYPVRDSTGRQIRYADIDDWKTDKKIEMEHPMRGEWKQYMLYPLEHLEHCNFNGYSLQLSLYMYMCEYYGFTPRKLGITHVREEVNWHKVPYMKKEIEQILRLRAKELKLVA